MDIIDVKLSVSDLTAAGLKDGSLKWMAGDGVRPVIVNSATSKIAEIPKIAMINSSNNSVRTLPQETGGSLSLSFGSGIVLGIGISAIAASVVYGVYKGVKYFRDKKKEKEALKECEIDKPLECELDWDQISQLKIMVDPSKIKALSQDNSVIKFPSVPELETYLNSTHEPTCRMSIDDIKKVANWFERYSNGDLSIEISQEEMLVLRNIIVRYTRKLYENNPKLKQSGNLPVLEAPSEDKNDLVLEIKDSLVLQEKAFA